MQIHERIRKLNKSDESYWCEQAHREPGYLVLRYDVKRDWHLGDTPIPAGSLTLGHYRDAVSYVLWEMYDPQRALIGYCYHVCLPPQIGKDYVEYLDLLLDLWFDPAGNLTVLDEDEVAAAVEARRLDRSELEIIACVRETIPGQHAEIIAGLWKPAAGIEAL